MAAHQAPPSLGFSRQEHWSGSPFPSPMHESKKWKWSRSVVSDSQRPHGLQPSRLLRPWDFPGKSTGVGCHCLLQFLSLDYSKNSKDSFIICGSLKAKQSTRKPFIYNVSALETVVSFLNYTSSSWWIFQQVLSLSPQKEYLLSKMITFLIPKVHILKALDTWYFQGPS